MSLFGKKAFRLLCIVFVVGCAWTMQGLTAETVPDWNELAHAKPFEQRTLLEDWARKARLAREADPKWKPDEKWRLFMAQLARTPLENPKLCEFTASVFRDIGECSDECLAFCDAWAQCKEGNTESNGNNSVLLLRNIHATGLRVRDFVLGVAKSLNDPRYAYDFLSDAYRDDAIVKSAILADIESSSSIRRQAAAYSLVHLKLEKAEATVLFKHFVRLASVETPIGEMRSFSGFGDAIRK